MFVAQAIQVLSWLNEMLEMRSVGVLCSNLTIELRLLEGLWVMLSRGIIIESLTSIFFGLGFYCQ